MTALGRRPFRRGPSKGLFLGGLLFIASPAAVAQGPSPETGNTIFPGGAFVSYGANLVLRKRSAPASLGMVQPGIRPTFAAEQLIEFGWGIHRDLELVALLPINHHRLDFTSQTPLGQPSGTGLGDAILALKYRFLRLDSERGTTQASISFGPKLPTGRTDLRDGTGALLPAGLQPGSGSTDLFLNFSGTYTGLFHIEKLVADETLTYLYGTTGTQQTRLGDFLEARLYMPYRPYQTHVVGKEWWIGPSLTWQHLGGDRIAGVRQAGSGGNYLGLGLTTYFSPCPGMELWFGVDLPVAQEIDGGRNNITRRLSFGIAKQFKIGR